VSETRAGQCSRCPKCKGRIRVPPVGASERNHDRHAPGAACAPTQPLDRALFDLPPAAVLPASPPVAERTHARKASPPSAFDVLLYPLNVSGIIHLVIFSLLPPLWKYAATLGFWLSPGIGPLLYLMLLTLYFVHYAAMCLSHSAGGGTRAPDINSDSTPLSVDALFSTAQTILPAVVLIWGPPLAYYLFRQRWDAILAAWLAMAGFMFPMIILAVNDFDSLRGANPLLVVPSIAEVFRPYGLLVLGLFALSALAGLLMYLSVAPRGAWVLRPAVFYVLFLEIHLLGRFYRRYQERLNWST
jgi:hypothetical protein